jgi:hypothetical protein
MSPFENRELIEEREVFDSFDASTPFIYISRSGTLFNMKELDNPDSLFIPEHLNQSKESLLKALKVVEKI